MTQSTSSCDCRWISIAEASALANVSRQAIHQRIAQGRVASLQSDDGPVVAIDELHQFLEVRAAAATVSSCTSRTSSV